MVTTARETKIKPGYKQTEVGVIPEEWMITKLGEVADVKTGPFGSTLHEKDYVDDGTPIITVEHLGEYGVAHESLPMVSEGDRKRLGAYSLLPGDIVFSRVGSVDRNSLIREEERGWLFSGRLLRIRIKTLNVFAPFLSYYFRHESTKQRIRTVAVGQTMASLNTQILRNIDIAFPSITSEQITIATTLSDVDALLTSLDKLIAKKRDIKQATMQQLLTGKMRLPGFDGEWEMKSLGENLKVRHGKSQQGIVANDGMYPILATSGEIGRTNDYLYDKPSVLIGRKGTINSPQYMDTPFWTIDTLFYTEVSEHTHAKFIYYLFNMIDWLKYNEASGVPSLNASTIESIEIQYPSLPEQIAIATVLSDMDAEIAALERRREKTRALKQGMMQELLSGKTRLL
ncbi:MAG TPA: restriction endonuclease subunit S [Ktedonobacteraceae bacterium]|nr:restriction endonuclease subunit S [Ktedonobacteraceae bacterium]